MIPGMITKISEEPISLTTTISPKSDLVHVTSTTTTTVLATIIPPFTGSSGIMVILNRSGANMTTVTTGNIAAAVTIPVNLSCVLTYSLLTGKFYPGAIS